MAQWALAQVPTVGEEVENPLSDPGYDGADGQQARNPWLVDMERAQDEKRDANGALVFRYANGDPTPLDWCFVMRLDRSRPPLPMPDEARELVERLFIAGLYVKHHIGVAKDELYIQIGVTLLTVCSLLLDFAHVLLA